MFICASLTAGLVYLSYPARSVAGLAWLAWAPFLAGISRIAKCRTAFLYGWFTAFLFHTGLFYWIYYTCVHGGGLSVCLSVAAWLGLSALLALQTGLFGAACWLVRKSGPFFPLLAACGFVALEFLHQTIAFYGLGFPWLMWGYTQWNTPVFLQLAAYSGVYGVSFVLIGISACVAQALSIRPAKRKIGYLILALLVWLGLYLWGNSRLSAIHFPQDTPVSVALLQPNIDQYKKWDPVFEQEIVDTILAQGEELEGKNIRLAVWPESVVPDELENTDYQTLMENIAARSGAYQAVGSSLSQGAQQYVGAYLIAPLADGLQVYKKEKLVPFGEYIPFEKIVRKLFPRVDILGELGMFSAGAAGQKLLNMNGLLLGSTICYEAIFPQLWRKQGRQGAQLFVNLTNDAWFFDTAAPYQHFAANVLRAVETGRPVLRAANTG
ncbi:MAG: apolipoprotein N-acyltransferase, partial [Elusimicrobiaceae bacterium]|nr:apolipoprotein N-acyltransferase [Elusimicrobiaceae bacterium]